MPRVEFGADGIRGIVGEWPFLSPVVVRIGQALGRYISERSEHPFVVIGRDTRSSGQDLLSCLRAGLGDQGVDVINLGVMTTPGVASITRQQKANLGVIVSASHSPHQYNGIKLVNQNGLRLQREEEIEIEFLIDECVNRAVDLSITPGHQTDGQHLIELYIQDHVKRCPVQSLEGLKVVLDCACGAASWVAPEAFRRSGADVVAINDVIEGKDINYECGSEYVRVSPRNLVDVMRQYDASYGFAFDGDGDRLVVVDSNEQVFDGHDLLFVLAVYFHSKGLLRGDTVVAIHRANRGLTEALGRAGIQTVHTDNGDKNVEAAMWGGDFLLGGEPGGNIIINDGHHTAADAVYTALVLGGVLIDGQEVSLSEMSAPLQKHPQITKSLKLPALLTFEQRAVLQREIKYREAQVGRDGRILAWDSSTEPGVVRVMVEGSLENTVEEVSAIADAICQLIRQSATPGTGQSL